MKHEWKKDEKAIYLPKGEPCKIEIPSYKFYTLCGAGNPNSEAFAEEIGVLYSLSYGIKMMRKKGAAPSGYFEYSVYPLEGIWSLSERAIKAGIFDKNEFVYKIMIRQPDFVTEELAAKNLENIKKSKPSPLLDKARFEEIADGLCVQMLHTGSYDDEPKSFEKMKEFCAENDLIRHDLRHREIYISDARKTAPEKLKTVLRYFVAKDK